MDLIIGISGASGAIYGIRTLEVLANLSDVKTHLIVTESGEKTIRHETDWTPDAVAKLATAVYDNNDLGAALASGSFRRDGMIIAPCSVKSLSSLATSYANNLLTRAADVNLKERKPLVVMLRETPLHLGHLRNMARLTEMGAILFPPVPSFYNKPETIEDLISSTVGRVLDLFDIDHGLTRPWSGLKGLSK